MNQKSAQTFNIDKKYHKDILTFISLNEIKDVDVFINKCFKKGFDIEKYGLLGNETEVREVEKIVEVPVEKVVEIIKEVPVPPVEIEVIKYVDREVIKEVPVEKVVSNIDNIYDKNKVKMLENTLLNLRKELQIKQSKIDELEKIVLQNTNAIYLKGSNLNQKL